MSIKQVRNRALVPDLNKEGVFTKPIVLATTKKHGVSAYKRLFSYHTLASTRKLSFFKPHQVISCSLDLALQSTYQHSHEAFADREDVVLQPETRGCPTTRRMRNTRDVTPPIYLKLGHPLRIGGVRERKSPHSVKLLNSGVHSAQTNPGYSRQPAGGGIFFY